jgi:hypothetical protein
MNQAALFCQCARSFLLGFAVVCLLAGPAQPLPCQEITSTDPGQYVQNSGVQFLELLGKDLIPDGSTYLTIPVDVKVLFDDGKGWKQGTIEIPGKDWGKGALTVSAPMGVIPTAPSLRVKLVVKGVDSNVYAIPIFTLNPSGPPKITSIRPEATAVGANAYYFMIEVFTNASAAGQLYFNNQKVPSYLSMAQSPDVILHRFPVPDSMKDTPGSYPIQLRGGGNGDTNIVYWSLLEKLAITSASPQMLSSVDVAPGAPAKAFQFGFSGSAPSSVELRVDEAGNWSKISGPVIVGNQVFVGIPLASYKPAKKIEIRLKNAVSEAVKSYAIVPSPQAAPEKTAAPAAVFLKLAITSAMPAVLNAADVAPGAPAKAFRIGYSGSSPDTVEIRIDGRGNWSTVPDPVIARNAVSFSLSLGAYRPANKIEIRLRNAVSEAVKAYAIIPSLATQANKVMPAVIRKK